MMGARRKKMQPESRYSAAQARLNRAQLALARERCRLLRAAVAGDKDAARELQQLPVDSL